MNKTKRGGYRKGSGRKPLNEKKKKPVTLYVELEKIMQHGMDGVRGAAHWGISNKLN